MYRKSNQNNSDFLTLKWWGMLMLIFGILEVNGQIGGKRAFVFLDLPPSARMASLGGSLNMVRDGDPWSAEQNPALLNVGMTKRISTTLVNYLSDVQYGHTLASYHLGKWGTCMAGIKYINYGTFAGRDEVGRDIGNFQAGENAISLGYGIQLPHRFSVGMHVTWINSQIAGYRAQGIGFTIGTAWQSKDTVVQIGAVLRNAGWMTNPYVSQKEPFPTDLQIGFSVKPKHMPIRLSLTGVQLQRRDLTFIDPSRPKQVSAETGEEIDTKPGITTKVFNHLVVGTEFLFGKVFQIRFGMNPRMRRELQLNERRGMTGFSWGFGMQIKKIGLSYGSTVMHVGQTTHLFSFMLDASAFKVLKK